MKTQSLSLATVLLAALVFSGCIEQDRAITVRPNGSGQVTEVTTIQGDKLMAMQKVSGDKGLPFFDRLYYEKQANSMGTGVTLSDFSVSDGEKGAKIVTVIYSFTDINTLTVSAKASNDSKPAKNEESVRFSMEKGDPSTLKVTVPFKPAPLNPEKMRKDLSTWKRVLEGLKLSVKLELVGEIVETDADHVDGNTIVLIAMDLEKMTSDEERFIQAATEQDPAMSRELNSKLEGVTLQSKETITVQFR